MSLFNGKIYNGYKYIVLSASRMVDMPKFYQKEIIEEVKSRIEKGIKIHTLVLWTKHPGALLENPLHNFLLDLKQQHVQLYIQLTITGLGGVKVGFKCNGKPLILEPNIPNYQDSLGSLLQIISLVGNPRRIRLRVDPIIRLIDNQSKLFSSLKYFQEIVEAASELGIKDFSFSFLEKGVHQKVDRRFKKTGCEILSPNRKERQQTEVWFKKIAKKFNINIFACCVPGFPISKCINGELLQTLHDKNLPTDLRQPKRRDLCGCTNSIDIGGWPPKKCNSGCEYCYANAFYF